MDWATPVRIHTCQNPTRLRGPTSDFALQPLPSGKVFIRAHEHMLQVSGMWFFRAGGLSRGCAFVCG
jgi:hypothetical protein